jgi:Holliday junction resolvase
MTAAMPRARGAKRDRNESRLVHYLREQGAVVYRISGAHLPDLLVGYAGRWWPVEVKLPRRQLSAGQAEFAARVRYRGLPVGLIRDEIEAAQLLQTMATDQGVRL